MAEINIRDILIGARQESTRMLHYYIGVEHLFIGLLDIQGGLLCSTLERHGLTADYVKDAVRRRLGKGSDQRLWPGIENSPRANVVLSLAQEDAENAGRAEINERDLLLAILEEADNVPVRVLRTLKLDIDDLSGEVRQQAASTIVSHPFVRVDFAPDFEAATDITDEHLLILRRMFYGYSEIRIDRQLTGGYTSALVFVVTPTHADGAEDAAVVVKIDDADNILDEAQRYALHVKNSLPPLTARLEDQPTTADTSDLAGIKYTFISDNDSTAQNLRTAAGDFGPTRLADWLRKTLYPVFGKNWWKQRQPFRFAVWNEYDFLLPPLLTLDYVPPEAVPPNAAPLTAPVRRARLAEIDYGDTLVLDSFIVQRVYKRRGAIQIALGTGSDAARRASRIEIRGLDFSRQTYFRGEKIDRIAGNLYSTRRDTLLYAVNALAPDFEANGQSVPYNEHDSLANPIFVHAQILEMPITGSFSKIHGDLHLGNILVGMDRLAFLIDFANARVGHTVFDWATLEMSLWTDVVMRAYPDATWTFAREMLGYFSSLRSMVSLPGGQGALPEVLHPILALRQIAAECLTMPGEWAEYDIALGFSALRAVTWEHMSPGSRRLMFYVAAMAFDQAQRALRSTSGSAFDAATDVIDKRSQA